MSEMVDRVAAAIRPLLYGSDLMADSEVGDIARAAIEAMREPTEAMVEAGWDTGLEYGPGDALAVNPEVCFSAMIDAALKG
jgi:hypothetical protein